MLDADDGEATMQDKVDEVLGIVRTMREVPDQLDSLVNPESTAFDPERSVQSLEQRPSLTRRQSTLVSQSTLAKIREQPADKEGASNLPKIGQKSVMANFFQTITNGGTFSSVSATNAGVGQAN